MIPTTSGELPWGLVGLYFLVDGLLAVTLVVLLCQTERRLPPRLEAWFPLKGRWLYWSLVGLIAMAHLASGIIVWLPLLLPRKVF